MIDRMQRTGRVPAFVLALISAVTLATVYASQFIGGLVPCELCLYQRWPWWAALLLCILAMPTLLSTRVRAALVALAGLSVLAGAGVAVFHVGVEQHWWPGLASCSAAGQTPASFEQMQQMLSQPTASCDEPAWTMFGISMAGYNAIGSLVVGVWAIVTALGLMRGKDGGRAA